MLMNFFQHFTGNKGMVFHNLHDDVLDNFNTAQWASLGVEMDKTPGGNFLL